MYRGRATIWQRILDPEGYEPVLHYHSCPQCYEHKPCTMDCTLEPDLELRDGSPCGSHVLCDACELIPFKLGA